MNRITRKEKKAQTIWHRNKHIKRLMKLSEKVSTNESKALSKQMTDIILNGFQNKN